MFRRLPEAAGETKKNLTAAGVLLTQSPPPCCVSNVVPGLLLSVMLSVNVVVDWSPVSDLSVVVSSAVW